MQKKIVLFGMTSSVNLNAQTAKVILYNSVKCLKRNVDDRCGGAQTEFFDARLGEGGGGYI
jgi:hypothetical protein